MGEVPTHRDPSGWRGYVNMWDTRDGSRTSEFESIVVVGQADLREIIANISKRMDSCLKIEENWLIFDEEIS